MTEIEALVEAVQQSARYRTVATHFIAHLGATELARRRSFKEAVKATKSKLHQAGGAYLVARPRYDSWLSDLRAARSEDDEEAHRAVCLDIMRHQSSSRERLPILADFYRQTLAPIAPVRTVLDMACGLNPLAIPWMPLAPGAKYWAYDIYDDMIAFLGQTIPLCGVEAHVCSQDVTRLPPTPPVDLALMLKVIPCLDHLDQSAASRLLEVIDARHFLISFPVRSLGGKAKGMVATYEARMDQLLVGRSWQVRRLEFPSELAFVLSSR
jgi:16S rRNA (guanine(1405)-N(7))-methyltransferase